MIDVSFLKELNKFNLIINKRVTSKYTGECKSIGAGSGTIFKEHRIYAPGDNFKAIDWRVYARTDDLYVKVFEEERNLNVHILIDTSGSMAFNNKFDYAARLGLGFAFLALKNNEKIHFSTFAKDMVTFRGSKGQRQIISMIDHLNKIKPAGESEIFNSIREYKKNIHSRSFIVIISDFLTDVDKIIASLQLLGKGHTVKIVQVLDIEEKDMPLEGDFNLLDSESSNKLRTYISKRTQQTYIKRLNQHVNKIKTACTELGFQFFQFTSEKPIFDTFFELVNN